MAMHKIFLKKGKENLIHNRRLWIYSGAIQSGITDCEPGNVVQLCTHDGSPVAIGFANPIGSLSVRIFSFSDIFFEEEITAQLTKARARRAGRQGSYRMVHAEADGLPGLIIDWYDGIAVFQANTAAMQRFKPLITRFLTDACHVSGYIESSDPSFLKQEGIDTFSPLFWGDIPEKTTIKEDDFKYETSLLDTQKTGFYLDQRDNRHRLATLVRPGETLLNGCAFTGAFSIIAAAKHVTTTSVDISKKAIQQAKDNFKHNGLSTEGHTFIVRDIFEQLSSDTNQYDTVIIDPPAFAKKQDHLPQAIKGYTQLHLLALSRVKPGGRLLTCSCSHALDWEKYETVIRHASSQLDKTVHILGRYTQPTDHPIVTHHPESEYLRTFILEVG